VIIEVRYQAIRPGPETHASFSASISISLDPADRRMERQGPKERREERPAT